MVQAATLLGPGRIEIRDHPAPDNPAPDNPVPDRLEPGAVLLERGHPTSTVVHSSSFFGPGLLVARIMAMTTTSLADAKNRLSELVASAETTHERTVVTKNGRPAAVLMSVDDLASLEETLALLSDRDALVDLAESEVTARHGLFYTSDDTWDGTHAYSAEESERRLVARMGRQAYDSARAAVRADLLASPDAAVRERAAEYA